MIGDGNYSIVPMKVFKRADFTFLQSAILQIVTSAEYAAEQIKSGSQKAMLMTDFSLLTKFVTIGIEICHSDGVTLGKREAKPKVEQGFTVHLTGDQLLTVQAWLQAKHDHCDENRTDPAFNFDTFYFLKELIMDIDKCLLPQRLDTETERVYKAIYETHKPK